VGCRYRHSLRLIINELISNALKYAFPENRPGEIRVALWQRAGHVPAQRRRQRRRAAEGH